jgi:hypothetical protein
MESDAPSQPMGLTKPQRVLMLLLNAWPLCHLLATAAAALWLPTTGRWRFLIVIASVYLVPPLLCRTVCLATRPSEGELPAGSRDFFVWWAMLQTQVLFLRLPWLDELLRFVPGLYSAWLRLWGARVGRLTYWAPGVVVLDRPYLEIGNDVRFAAGVRLASHLLVQGTQGAALLLGTIRIGDGASLGGYATLGPGSEVAAGDHAHAFLVLPPFAKWKAGRRTRALRDLMAAGRPQPSEAPRE